jgi:hypothetical protein
MKPKASRTVGILLVLGACGRSELLETDPSSEVEGHGGGDAGECSTCRLKVNGGYRERLWPTCPGRETQKLQALLDCACREETCNYHCAYASLPTALCNGGEVINLGLGCLRCFEEKCALEADTCMNEP